MGVSSLPPMAVAASGYALPRREGPMCKLMMITQSRRLWQPHYYFLLFRPLMTFAFGSSLLSSPRNLMMMMMTGKYMYV